MYHGNWTCSQCGGAITELPFQPRSEKGLTCRDCFLKQKNGGQSSGSTTTPPTTTPAPDEFSSGADAPPPDIPDDAELASEAPPAPDFEDAVPATPGAKPRFTGDWSCATCGESITSLPFQPRSTENLKCLDCFKASR